MSKTRKKLLSMLLSVVMLAGTVAGVVPAQAAEAPAESSFAQSLEAKYVDPDRVYSADVRWWLDKACYTDEVLLQEIQNLYDSGFRGVELCMRSDSKADMATFAYGSDMWAHKWKLMMNKILDLGMTLSLTSGTNWSTTNVTGLDPDSQAASQVVAMGTVQVKPGETITALPKPATMRESNKGKFLGAYAYKLTGERQMERPGRRVTYYTEYTVDFTTGVELTKDAQPVEGETVYDQALTWTAPDDGTYVVMAYWTHGNYKTASPAIDAAYAVNYFDERGVEAMRTYWEAHILDDPELNAKIKEGDVQLFMDSIELNPDGGITWWTESMRQAFIDRKGYDPMPYLFLVDKLPQVAAVYNAYQEPALGGWDLKDDSNTREKFINDWVDVLTQEYIENMLVPMKEWLNGVGIKTRAQISYGRSFEITEPSAYVDYPEAEDFNQYCQPDVMRLHVGGAKLQNKVVGSETGAIEPTDASTMQQRLFESYSIYAAGIQRIVWHIWSTQWGWDETGKWPGTASGFDRIGDREITYRDFDEWNAHTGRIQQLLQTGKSRTDIGFIHNNWNQGICFGAGIGNNLSQMNWKNAHMGVYYRSTELQDNGYTYDYISPDLLKAEGVYFNEETDTIELAGYKALVIYQNWLDLDGAKLILDWAKQGLKVVVLEHAAQRTPFLNAQADAELAEVMAELKALPTVREAEIYGESDDFDYFKPMAEGYDDGVLEALEELGVRPYAQYAEPNHQLLTQARVDENGNEYLYVYNYCDNELHEQSYIEEVRTEDHGTNIQTEIRMDGIFVPYQIDAWSGEVTELAGYYYEDGQTVFPIDLDFNNIALYAFEKVDSEKLHVVDTNADAAYVGDNGVAIRATKSGKYYAVMNDGVKREFNVEVPTAFDITNWDLTVSAWSASDEKIYSEETINGVYNKNSKVLTKKTDINVKLDKLATWDQIEALGQKVSGEGHYKATFNWDSSKADGAYINFGTEFYNTMEVWMNGVKVGGRDTTNPTKIAKSIVEGKTGAVESTGGINWMHPIVDVGAYLKDGENTIVLEYSSNLGNVMLTKETISKGNWHGIDSKRLPYGPAQAVVVPYVDEEISTANITLTGPTEATVEDALTYTVSVEGANQLATVTLEIAAENLDELKPADGWYIISQNYANGVLTALLGNNAGVTGDADIAQVVCKPNGKPAALTVTVKKATLSSYDGEGETFVNALLTNASVTTQVDYSVYDVNQDGTVNQLDITRAQRAYGAVPGDANWNVRADVNKDSVVDINDLILVLNNYSK